MQKNIKILVVDNDLLAENSISQTLYNLKFDFNVVNDEEALSEFKEQTYDLTFLNMETIKDRGIPMLKNLIKLHPEHYIVMLVNVATPEIVKETIEIGATGFLNKPFSPRKILHELEKFILLNEDKLQKQNAL